MFLKNQTKDAITKVAYGGYYYTIHPGVSAVDDEGGEFMLKLLAPRGSGGGVAPLILGNREDWKGQYVSVVRFTLPLDFTTNRPQLVKMARDRGVSEKRIQEYDIGGDAQVQNEEILQDINQLPIPEAILIPERLDEPVQQTPPVASVGEFPCPDCDKSFSKRIALVGHQRTHAEEKTTT